MLLEKVRDIFSPGETCAAIETDRRDSRRRAVLLRASIYPIDVFSDVIVRDASQTGIMGDADAELAIGQTIHLSLDERTYHSGVVRWTRGRRFGLELPRALAIFASRTSTIDHGYREGHAPRAGRVKLNVCARLSAGRPPRPATVRNVSGMGMLLDTGPGLLAGQHLVVRLGQCPAIYGRVQWSRDGKIGIRATTPISVLSLACADM